jgi:HK97 family phage major capsid protein/HK97 family phage prohead protease
LETDMKVSGRAYSLLEIKSVDENAHVIRGVATTPEPDRMGDVVESLGMKFKNPMPLLWQHQADKPVGLVKFEKPTKNGINFEATLAPVVEPGALKDRVDEAWQSIKHQLVRAVSIGFRALEYSFMDDGGIHFQKTECLELSLVTIPANASATIQSIKSFDTVARAASGLTRDDELRPTPPASGKSKTTHVVKAQEGKIMKKTIAEQIAAFEATRTAKSARMDEIMDTASDTGTTLDATAKEEYDTLDAEVKEVDEHIVRLRAREATMLKTAAPVTGSTQDDAVASRNSGRSVVQVKHPNAPKGTAFTRYVLALARAQGNIMMAEQIAKGNEQWMAETPEVAAILKTAVNAGTTTDSTWAGPLVNYQIMASEFVDLLRPLTIIGRIPGLRNVPFKVKIPRQTGGSTVNWVGEGKVKPLTSLAFDTITMDFAKIAGIIPLSEELVRLSNPSAEALVRNDLAAAITQFMDNEFIDPTNAATDVSPASITYGVTPTVATGTTAAALRDDIGTLMGGFLQDNLQISSGVWIMSQTTALKISLMRNSLGTQEFPGISVNGGTFEGLPVVVSENVPYTGGSPTDGGIIVLANAGDILLADDGQVTIDASREASLQMETAPDSPPTASTTLVSLWQHNMMAIKAERYINWQKRRSTAVAYISSAKYAA